MAAKRNGTDDFVDTDALWGRYQASEDAQENLGLKFASEKLLLAARAKALNMAKPMDIQANTTNHYHSPEPQKSGMTGLQKGIVGAALAAGLGGGTLGLGGIGYGIWQSMKSQPANVEKLIPGSDEMIEAGKPYIEK